MFSVCIVNTILLIELIIYYIISDTHKNNNISNIL